MPVSRERRAQIRELSNDERVDRLDCSAFTEADWERFGEELDAETLAFCRDNRDSEELHAFAASWNWDKDKWPLEAILDNPACEAATALLIFWHAAPEFHLQYSNRDSACDPEGFDFVTKLEERYCVGQYSAGVIAFDPANPDGEPSLVGIYDELRDKFVRKLSPMMYMPVELKD